MSVLSPSQEPIVVIVDDDDDVRETIGRMLAARGFRVHEASGTEAALTICRTVGRVELIVADLSIPGDSPGWLERVIAEEFPDVRVVYATAVPRNVALATGVVRPATPYLEKPVHGDVLSNLLRSQLSRPPESEADSW
jgi:ActR/RegA family two-component response regulator